VTGVAGLLTGAMSIAADEYVWVNPQAETEKADLSRAPACSSPTLYGAGTGRERP
jgi:hypothetical protein